MGQWSVAVVLVEVDSRIIPGSGVEVTLTLDRDRTFPFEVIVVDPDSTELGRLACLTGDEALDAYTHPFARESIPDVFRCAS